MVHHFWTKTIRTEDFWVGLIGSVVLITFVVVMIVASVTDHRKSVKENRARLAHNIQVAKVVPVLPAGVVQLDPNHFLIKPGYLSNIKKICLEDDGHGKGILWDHPWGPYGLGVQIYCNSSQTRFGVKS